MSRINHYSLNVVLPEQTNIACLYLWFFFPDTTLASLVAPLSTFSYLKLLSYTSSNLWMCGGFLDLGIELFHLFLFNYVMWYFPFHPNSVIQHIYQSSYVSQHPVQETETSRGTNSRKRFNTYSVVLGQSLAGGKEWILSWVFRNYSKNVTQLTQWSCYYL